ncbi:OLC1v1015216C1 [Oldenlandia corymbosa var. corymbosa]|uniref:OLC1v1015216C1 n=1 Tax=Oldenlandia corymbosa var. corymbosa TaxID=529605 RepID=A0AAV1E3H7_OLDCO|nr:OLC1v1015216C1 [Oldenlandia corymbosa var. corymbosa]
MGEEQLQQQHQQEEEVQVVTAEEEVKKPSRTDLQRQSSHQFNYFHKYRLYRTHSNFYMVGYDKSKTFWKVLKIDRLEPCELNLFEDPTTYSLYEFHDLFTRIHIGNEPVGGLEFVTTCYGIVGFVRFLGPYHMILITKRKKVGKICGHAVYSIAKTMMIPVPNSTVLSNLAYSKNENRYKKLLCAVDLTKDFYFSYTYNIMLSVQKNLGNHESLGDLYETMFVWNEYLTREIRSQLQNTRWTVALIFGFFEQVKILESGRSSILTLVARRSRHNAGTRFLRRGVNEKGYVANDVETEQIVYEDVCDTCSTPITSIVQNRGSIPLFWSQETSRLYLKPDIILSRKDPSYEATRRHFEDLAERYGNPIIIMNLVKTNEKKPRESILRAKFIDAIEFINKDLPGKNHLKFLHWDLNKSSKECPGVLGRIVGVASNALNLTGFFYCEKGLTFSSDALMNSSYFEDNTQEEINETRSTTLEELVGEVDHKISGESGFFNQKPVMFQNGVLRTNCIDCLDRTNAAQYAYGLVALGRQLYALGLLDDFNINLDSALAEKLMKLYEEMGDTLALQYGGSTAHKKIFSEKRGHWKAATQSHEFLRTLQRYYSNAYMDAQKQDAIDVFLGNFRPQHGKPALWEPHSGPYDLGAHISDFADEISRFMKRSLSDGSILCQSKSVEDPNVELDQDDLQSGRGLLGSTSEIAVCESEDFSRHTPSVSCKHMYPISEPGIESDVMCVDGRDTLDFSNFMDIDLLSSSGNSIEDETYEGSTLISASSSDFATYANANQFKDERNSSAYASSSGFKGGQQSSSQIQVGAELMENYSEKFISWIDGDMFF